MSNDALNHEIQDCSTSRLAWYVGRLSLVAMILWTLAFCWYEFSVQRDAYWTFRTHSRLLLTFQILEFAIVVTLAWHCGLSVGWLVSMFLIAMLCSSLCMPTAVRAANSVREQLAINRHFELDKRTIAYAVFSILQILGFVFAWISKNWRRKQFLLKVGAETDEVKLKKDVGP